MFKSIINYIRYRKFIKENRDELINEFGVKIDNLYRLGARVSIPDNKIEVMRNYNNSELDVFKSLNEEVTRYISRIDRYFMQKNVSEYIGIYSADRTDFNQVTLIMTYKLMNLVKVANYSRLLSTIAGASLFLGFVNLFYMIPGAFLLFLIILMNMALFKKLFI